jgi:hypothetical protein
MVASKKAASLSPEITKQISDIENMTLAEVRKLMLDCLTNDSPSKYVGKDIEALTKAANKRMRAIRREVHDDPLRARELLGR